jgi:hypothetical protein
VFRASIGCRVNLAHTRIQATKHLSRLRGLRDGQQCADSDHGQAGPERETLRDAARDAQTRERAWTFAERNGIELGELDPGLREQRVDHRQHELRVTLLRMAAVKTHLSIQPQSRRTVLRRCFQGKNFHWALKRIASTATIDAGRFQHSFVQPIIRVELEAFAEAIAERAPFPVSAADMLATVAAFEAVVEALESGRTGAVGAQR